MALRTFRLKNEGLRDVLTPDVQAELDALRKLNASLAERVAAQSELLSRRAEQTAHEIT